MNLTLETEAELLFAERFLFYFCVSKPGTGTIIDMGPSINDVRCEREEIEKLQTLVYKQHW